ncbi:MAG: hypothetical protein HRT37_15460 [Alteromonadaceae bacterium]|nr:hypothetical protein [Alteromonadaceae bacterium]
MKQIVCLLLLWISLSGCASQNPFEMAQHGPTMKDHYQTHMSGGTESTGVPIDQIDRALENDLNYRHVNERAYKRLSNPELEMFVYPHRVTSHGIVVPGYTIRFPMYEKVHYALPGDVDFEN